MGGAEPPPTRSKVLELTKSGARHSFHRLGARVQMDHVEIQKGRVLTAVLGGVARDQVCRVRARNYLRKARLRREKSRQRWPLVVTHNLPSAYTDEHSCVDRRYDQSQLPLVGGSNQKMGGGDGWSFRVERWRSVARDWVS